MKSKTPVLSILLLLLAVAPAPAEDALPAYEVPPALAGVEPGRPELVAELVASIRADRVPDSREAWRVLAALGRDAAPTVIAALPDTSWFGRALLVRALAESRVPEVAPVLLAAATDPAWAVREAAAPGLSRIESADARTRLVELCGDTSWRVRAAAAVSLRRFFTRVGNSRPEVIDALLKLAADPDPEVRIAGLRELGSLAADEGRDVLLLGFTSDDEDEREVSFAGLLRLDGARDGVLEALEEALSDSDDELFLEAATRYAELTGPRILGNEAALHRLIRFLRTRTLEVSKVFREAGRESVPILLDALREFYASPSRIPPAQGDFSRTVLDLVEALLKEEAAPVLEEILRTWNDALPARRHALVLARRYHSETLGPVFEELYDLEEFADMQALLLDAIASTRSPNLPGFLERAVVSGRLYLQRVAHRVLLKRPDIRIPEALGQAVATQDANPEITQGLLHLMFRDGSPGAFAAAEVLLGHVSPEFRAVGAEALGSSPERARAIALLEAAYAVEDGRHKTEDLAEVERVTAERERVVAAILRSARLLEAKGSLPLLQRALGDADPVVREKALEELSLIATSEAVESVLAALERETDPLPKREALRAAVQMGGPEVERIIGEWLAGDDPDLRIDVLRALARADEAGVPPIVRSALKSGGWDSDAREVAVELLSRDPEEEDVALLARLVREDTTPEVRRQAVRALGAGGSPAAVDILNALLPGEDGPPGGPGGGYELAADAAVALGDLGRPEAVTALLAALSREWPLALADPTDDGRHFGLTDLLLDSLARIRDPRAICPILDLLLSPRLHRAFSLLGAEPPRDRKSLLGSVIKALVRFPDEDLAAAADDMLGRMRESGEAYRIDESYLLYVAALLGDPRREEIGRPQPRRMLAARLDRLVLDVAPVESPSDLAALRSLASRAANTGDFGLAHALTVRRNELHRILDPAGFEEEHAFYLAEADFYEGLATRAAGDEAGGLVIYRRGLARDREDSNILNLYAWWLAVAGWEMEDALDAALAAGRRDASEPAVLDTLGFVLHRLGRHEEAILALDQAWLLDRERAGILPDPLLRFHLAAALAAAGSLDSAADMLDEAVSMDDTLADRARGSSDFAPLAPGGLLEAAIKRGLSANPE